MSESQSIEYKSSWRDEYLKWICGFANAQGGKLYIGVDDNGYVCGVSNIKRLLEDIPNKIQTSLGIVTEVNKKEKDGLEYIEIIVVPSSFPVSYRGKISLQKRSHQTATDGHCSYGIHCEENWSPLGRRCCRRYSR